jgi:hypothetical protein
MRKLGKKPQEWVACKWCRNKKEEAARGKVMKGINKELHRRATRKTQVSLRNEVCRDTAKESGRENAVIGVYFSREKDQRFP